MNKAARRPTTKHGDRTLVRLSKQIVKADVALSRLYALPDYDSEADFVKALVQAIWEKRDAMRDIPATTHAGLQAKARIICLFTERDDEDGSLDYEDDGLAASLAADLPAAAA